jgi:hypothetical protein
MSNNKQQTAVEWFGIEIGKLFSALNNKKISVSEFQYKRFELEEKAKEMEKEKMIDFAIAYSAQDQYKTSAEDYYTENYGGSK